MGRKRNLAINLDQVSFVEPIVIDKLEEKTIEDYKSLNEKCDDVIVKIKRRKEKKK
jgi:hypothetical protein